MSTTNPTFLDQTTRIRPAAASTHSRSPARSPVRKAQFQAQEIDPLLGNLSPSSTLQALSLTEALKANRPKDADILAESIAEASTAERAHGIKAAVAAQKLREWHEEVLGWKWPAKKDRRLGKGFQPKLITSPRDITCSPNGKQKQFLGSLPRAVVAQHEERIEEIKDGLEALNVEELKALVLRAHIPSRSNEASTNDSHSGVAQLSDFTAVITHTMLQALPYLSKLTALLNDWDVRLLVLRQVPYLLQRLRKAESAIEFALEDLCARHNSGLLTKARFEEAKACLEKDVSLSGAAFDISLDLLEGREDSLPETWIERMDKIETKFAQWTVEAERRVLYNEWMEQTRASMPQRWDGVEGSNVPRHGMEADEFLLHTSAQDQSVRGPKDGIKTGTTMKPSTYQFPNELLNETYQFPKIDDQTQSSAIALEPHAATASIAHPVASASSDEEHEPQSAMHATMVPDFASISRISQPTEEGRSELTPEAQRTSPFATDFTPMPNSEASTLKANDTGKHTHQPQELDVAFNNNIDWSSNSHDRLNSATLDHISEMIDQLPSATHSAIRQTEPIPTEPISEAWDQRYGLPPDHESSSLTSGPKVRQRLQLYLPQTKHRREISDISMADSTVSEAFSDLSTAEIVRATTAEALGSPRIVSHSMKPSRDDLSTLAKQASRGRSMDLPRQDLSSSESAPKAHKKAASMFFGKVKPTFPAPTKASDIVSDGEDIVESSERTAHQFKPVRVSSHRSVISRASISSVERIPKSRIRSIMVSRRDSSSSSVVSPVSPLDASELYARSVSAMSVSPLESRSSTSLSNKAPRKDYFDVHELKEEISAFSDGGDSQPPRVKDDHNSVPGIPRRSSKRLSPNPSADVVPTLSTFAQDFAAPSDPFNEPQDGNSLLQTWSTDPSLSKNDDKPTVKTPPREKSKAKADLLESKIQSLLTRIPARIRLLSDSEPESSPNPSPPPSSRSPSPIPSIILSPVKPKRRPQPNNSNTSKSDIRVFHLTRSTEPQSTPPVKLFVRLVGEHGERVMVRVGGGWADLGDYLRDYSLHHSKRGLNNGQFELASFPVSGQKDSKDSRVIPIGPELISKATTGGPIFPKTKSPMSSRPGSAMDHRPSAVDQRPSAVTPFGVLKPTRRRRSASATAMHPSDIQGYSQSSPTNAFPSDPYYLDNNWEPPPVPPIPQVRTLNPYFGSDPRSSGPPRHSSASASTSNSPTTPTAGPSIQPLDQSTPLSSIPPHQHRRTSLGTTSPYTAIPKPRSRVSVTAAGAGLTTTRSRPTTPATRLVIETTGISDIVDEDVEDEEEEEEEEAAPAPNIGSPSSRHSSGSTGVSPKLKTRHSMGDASGGMGGGIRRVFFRRRVA